MHSRFQTLHWTWTIYAISIVWLGLCLVFSLPRVTKHQANLRRANDELVRLQSEIQDKQLRTADVQREIVRVQNAIRDLMSEPSP